MSKKLKAEITFTLPIEGGFSRPPVSGVRPQISAGDIFTSCVVRSTDGQEEFPLGAVVAVEIEVLFWDEYENKFVEGMPVILHDGSRIVAQGRFIESLRK